MSNFDTRPIGTPTAKEFHTKWVRDTAWSATTPHGREPRNTKADKRRTSRPRGAHAARARKCPFHSTHTSKHTPEFKARPCAHANLGIEPAHSFIIAKIINTPSAPPSLSTLLIGLKTFSQQMSDSETVCYRAILGVFSTQSQNLCRFPSRQPTTLHGASNSSLHFSRTDPPYPANVQPPPPPSVLHIETVAPDMPSTHPIISLAKKIKNQNRNIALYLLKSVSAQYSPKRRIFRTTTISSTNTVRYCTCSILQRPTLSTGYLKPTISLTPTYTSKTPDVDKSSKTINEVCLYSCMTNLSPADYSI